MDIFQHAAPDCATCLSRPVHRAEHVWHLDEDGAWRVRWFLVCTGGHRVLVEPFGADELG